jgi:hypothetical protein
MVVVGRFYPLPNLLHRFVRCRNGLDFLQSSLKLYLAPGNVEKVMENVFQIMFRVMFHIMFNQSFHHHSWLFDDV